MIVDYWIPYGDSFLLPFYRPNILMVVSIEVIFKKDFYLEILPEEKHDSKNFSYFTF